MSPTNYNNRNFRSALEKRVDEILLSVRKIRREIPYADRLASEHYSNLLIECDTLLGVIPSRDVHLDGDFF